MENYLVPARYGEAEYLDKKSRFIGQVSPAETENEAMAFVQSVREKYSDAAHNVWAYSLRNGAMRWSDDGEPGGTSGQPTLNVFRSAEVYDVCCVVTRYFGGILLGSGGLVRAYSKAASLALEAAGLARSREWRSFLISCGYPQHERIRRLLSDLGAIDTEAEFGEAVEMHTLIPAETAESFGSLLADVTAGGASCREAGSVFRPAKIQF
ncbi:MAG: YigZ family protein [Clostridia bacterium]|nr:YigZ family protein [Clostridia bacterium]